MCKKAIQEVRKRRGRVPGAGLVLWTQESQVNIGDASRRDVSSFPHPTMPSVLVSAFLPKPTPSFPVISGWALFSLGEFSLHPLMKF